MRDVRARSAWGPDRAQGGSVSITQEAFIAALRLGQDSTQRIAWNANLLSVSLGKPRLDLNIGERRNVFKSALQIA